MIGRLIDDRYQVRSRIARGGMATVYVATDLRLERRVAVKIMHGHLADDEAFKERFVQEARSAARLAHPNVVSVFDQGQDSEMAYLVMEYLPGMTLRDLLREHHRLTPDQALDIMEAVLAGLQSAHRAGIVHRDLKPENVLLADDGRIKIGDFGLARAASANTASGQQLLGTIAYLSPELVTRGIADTRSDIYAAGIMMFEMLAGEQPFQGEQPMQIAYQHANDRTPSLLDYVEVPPELDDIVQWATEKNPEDRPADARTMLDELYRVHQALSDDADASARTNVLPAAVHRPAAPLAEPTTVAPEATEDARPAAVMALHRQGLRRARLGLLTFFAVILLAIAAGGLGWYFNAGPGADVAVPNVAKMTPDRATAALKKAGFTVGETTETPSLDIPKGQVVRTNPVHGTRLHPGKPVALFVSSGPRNLPTPKLQGLQEQQARDVITRKGFTVDKDTVYEFSEDAPNGTVISAQAKDLASGQFGDMPDSYPERQPIRLIVSVGQVPNVVGSSVSDARQTLQNVGLKLVEASEQFSDSVPKGAIISQSVAGDGPVVKGQATIRVVVSKGQDLVTIPDVSGQKLSDAMTTLQNAGLTPQTSIPDSLWSIATVSGIDPAANSSVKRGSTVKVTATLTL